MDIPVEIYVAVFHRYTEYSSIQYSWFKSVWNVRVEHIVVMLWDYLQLELCYLCGRNCKKKLQKCIYKNLIGSLVYIQLVLTLTVTPPHIFFFFGACEESHLANHELEVQWFLVQP